MIYDNRGKQLNIGDTIRTCFNGRAFDYRVELDRHCRFIGVYKKRQIGDDVNLEWCRKKDGKLVAFQKVAN